MIFPGEGRGAGIGNRLTSKSESIFLTTPMSLTGEGSIFFVSVRLINEPWTAPPSLFRPLFHKSRDELEQCILEQEQVLSSIEYKSYIFTIFDLQSHFNGAFARAMPYALNDAQLDEYFAERNLQGHCGLPAGLP